MSGKNDLEIIRQLTKRFGATVEYLPPSEEEEQFLIDRENIYEQYCWDFDAFVKHYQLIRKYGVDEKCLSALAWKIEEHLSLDELQELKSTEFYKLFKGHKTIENALIEREIME
ncbi:MAG: hypothetical protein WDZ80_08070 [Candidatus Paceibacterota bacterium]